MKVLRIFLAVLLLIIGLNALAGGYYALAGAENVPVEWLDGSPFHSYLIPGLFLMTVVAGSCLGSAAGLIMRKRWSVQFSKYTGVLLMLWIIIQVIIIGYVSWMQPAIFISGAVTVLLSQQLIRNGLQKNN